MNQKINKIFDGRLEYQIKEIGLLLYREGCRNLNDIVNVLPEFDNNTKDFILKYKDAILSNFKIYDYYKEHDNKYYRSNILNKVS